ncbi:MAG: copper transporter [Solirubrobacteraceae bacterium]
MFDFRYHALSLVAVFLALMIGLLLGVAIGDRGLVSSAERNVRDSLRADVRAARTQSADLRSQLADQKRIQSAIYPLLVEGRLSGQRVGLIGLGSLPDSTIRWTRSALTDTGGRLTAVTVIREPVPPAAFPGQASGGATPDVAMLKRFGSQVGAAFVGGGGLIRQVQRSLLESSSGQLSGITSVVLFRASRDDNSPAAAGTRAFEQGLVNGLTSGGTQVVGVESSTTAPSQIRWFNDRRLASVDNLDQPVGQAALVFTLAGANGAYGIKDTAQALVPNAAGGPRR